MTLTQNKIRPQTVKSIHLSEGLNKYAFNPCNISDSVNLEYNNGICRTRKSRKPVLFLNTVPDQIINCGADIYIRYNNTLKKMIKQDGVLSISDDIIPLSENFDSMDRNVIEYGNALYIFPDNIKISKGSEWRDYGTDSSISAKFNFVDKRTIYFPNGYEGETDLCDDTALYEKGTEIKFSWDEKIFTVVKNEDVTVLQDDFDMTVGTRITLDGDVSLWNNIPQNASAKVRTPSISDIAPAFYTSTQSIVLFSGNKMTISADKNAHKYREPINKILHVGQRVLISGFDDGVDCENTIVSIESESIEFEKDFDVSLSKTGISCSIKPIIPSQGYAILSDDRFIMADNRTNSVYISEKGNPQLFYKNPADENGACVLPLENDKNFTGLVSCGGEIYVLTDKNGYRIYGNSVLDFELSMVNCTGTAKNSKVLPVVCKNSFIYCSQNGIAKFKSSEEKIISKNVLINPIPSCAAVANGNYYCLIDGTLYVYNINESKWWCENAAEVTNLFSFDSDIYIVIGTTVYTYGGNALVDWSLVTGLFYDDKYCGRISPVKARFLLSGESDIKVCVIMQNGREKMVFHDKIRKRRFVNVPLGNNNVDGFYIKLYGTGDITVCAMDICYRRNRSC